MSANTKIEIEVKGAEKAFSFSSFQNWIQGGQEIWENHGLNGTDALCIDANGKVCSWGAHFRDALYPVNVYRIAYPTDPRYKVKK